jgi:hypothetical protein
MDTFVIDAEHQRLVMEHLEKSINFNVLDKNKNISKQRFGKNKKGYFQTLRLHYDPELERIRRRDRNSFTYENLRLTGIGGTLGTQDIWPESILGRLKSRNGKQRIKLAIGITMYNENWELFTRTIKGVCQGLVDIYNDELKLYKKKGKTLKWKDFKDKFVIVLIADGYRELTGKKGDDTFPPNAKKYDIFDESLIESTYCNKQGDGKVTLKSIEDIAKTCTRLFPETNELYSVAY